MVCPVVGATMAVVRDCFAVVHLDVERLLAEWRWLCPHPMTLVARNAFGDLFLRDESGKVFQLDVSAGKFAEVARSEAEFHALVQDPAGQEEWIAASAARASAERGLDPDENQCIAFSTPLVFVEARAAKPYIVDIYEGVSFLGDLHRQLSDVPDGAKARLKVGPAPSESSD